MKVIPVEKPASKGIAIAKAFFVEHPVLQAREETVADQGKQNEIEAFDHAAQQAVKDLEALAVQNDIFAAHLEVAQDITLREAVVSKIEQNNKNVEQALMESRDEISALFDSMEDEYFRERAADVKDVCNRIFCILKGIRLNPFEGLNEEVVVIAKELGPSDTANMDFTYVRGFITQEGGVTSHVCIMARSMELPAMVGVTHALGEIPNGETIILDAIEGKIILQPEQNVLAEYKEKKEQFEKHKKELEAMNHLPAETVDGRKVELFANVGSLEDVENALGYQAEGIGLFRSEFLYMEGKDFPGEEEQFQVYKKAVELLKKPIIIRTLDIGGDKKLPYYEFEKEDNPFLGWRAIRISLDLKEMFQAQLRALLRASAFGPIRIMYPMIISVDEFRQANIVLEECKTQLRQEGKAFNEKIETGIMVETPAAVLCADDLAKEVDFFSIGTNDLTQYLLAADRGNQKIAKLYNSFHPAVLRGIATVIEAGHRYGKVVGMCGEFASDEKAIPILLGLGLDEFSMAASAISAARYQIRNSSFSKCEQYAQSICQEGTVEKVMERLSQGK